MGGQGTIVQTDRKTQNYHQRKYKVFLNMLDHQRQYDDIMNGTDN